MREDKTEMLYARVPQTLLNALDRYVDVMIDERPGAHATRSDAIRELLYKALRAEGLIPEPERLRRRGRRDEPQADHEDAR